MGRIKIYLTLELYRCNFNENLINKISYGVAAEHNLFNRFIPLFLKNIILKIAYGKTLRGYSINLSNLGRLSVDEEYKPYVEYFECMMNVSDIQPIKCALCSYEEKLVITFSSRIQDTSIQRHFFRHLAKAGIPISVSSNEIP